VSLREAIDYAVRGAEVPGDLLRGAFHEIMRGQASDAAIAGLLVALRAKGETVDELATVARVLRAEAVQAPCLDPRTVDTCGTGGDGAGTFNISTTAAFKTGSIDVLEALGVAVDIPVQASAAILSQVGIAPFFARRAHPAMRHVAPVRQELGIRTLMNCMGPLLNPLGVRQQVIGVYEEPLVAKLARVLCLLGTERALVVHGSDGLDEITTRGTTRAAHVSGERVEMLSIDPADYDISAPPPEALRGGDAAENARILEAVLSGEDGPRRDVVVLNAAAALWVAGAASDLRAGLSLARQSIDSGAARKKLAALILASQGDEVSA
jgi:anthranilate phosphoribosyltransferase